MALTDAQARIYRVIVEVGEQSHDGDATLALNPDGQGLSVGGIQFTQASGNLGKLLARANSSFPLDFARAFPDVRELLRVTGVPSLAPVAGAVLWSEPWVSRFRAAGRTPWFQAVCRTYAFSTDAGFWPATREVADLLGLRLERSWGVVMDRCVNGGPGRATRAAKATAAWLATASEPPPEAVVVGAFLGRALEYVKGGRYEKTITERTWRVYESPLLSDGEMPDLAGVA